MNYILQVDYYSRLAVGFTKPMIDYEILANSKHKQQIRIEK